MKKIYILTAVFALLTLSLNAQDGNQDAAKAARAAIKNSKEMAPKAQGKAKGKANTDMNAPAPTMNELLAGIKGMTSVMPPSSNPNGSSTSSGSMRAPLKINSDEYLVGPYTTNDFSTNGYGFPDAYGGNGQQIYIFSDMSRSDFEQYDGDEIVGFRLALAGSSSQTAYLYEFYSWPYSTNGYFENANRHTWSIPEFGGAQPVTTYDDIVITTDNGYIGFTSIIVYNGNNVVTQWVGSTNQTTTPTDWIWTGGSHFASNNDGSYFMTYGSSSGGGIITIPGSLFENCTGDIRLVITAGADSGYGSNNFEIDVNGDPKTVTNENPTFNQFTWTFSPTTSLPVYLELTCGQWHEFYLDEPIPFNVNDTIAGLYLGYRYWQWGSSSTGEFMYPVAVNPNSTNDGIVSYRIGANGTTTSTQTLTSWSYADDGNTFPSTWTVPTHYAGELGGSYYFGGSNGANIVIPASDLQGNSTVTVKVTAGKENSNSHTISVNNSQKSLTTSLVEYTWDNVNASSGVTIHVSDYYVNISKIEVIGTATTPNYVSGWWNENMNGDLAVQLIFKSSEPELISPEDGSTVNVGTNEGSGVSTTIPVSGHNLTGDLTVSVSGTGFSVSPTTITAAEANAGTTITVTYNGYSSAGTGTLTITSDNDEVEPVTVNLTGNFVPQPIEPVTGLLRLHLLLVDQLKANIPDDNSHADSYRYVLKYEPAGEEAKESSPVKVDIHKTECEVKGYYTKAEIDGDTDGALTMNVLTADVEFNLTDDDNTIDFYNLQGLANEYPALGEDYLTKLQQTTGFVYYEMLDGSPNKGQDYPAGIHHYYDNSTPILTGTYTNGFMSYAPSLSTFGVERRYYEDDGLDNTYGAPIWRTRVGEVQIQGKPVMQKQVINAGTPQEAPNPYTSWSEGGKDYSLFFIGVNAQAMLPNVEGTYGTNIKYEPYMFRVFVSSPTGKLRKYNKVLGQGGGYYLEDGGAIAANEKYCVGSFYEDNGWHANDLYFSKGINRTMSFRAGGEGIDSEAWDGIMKFAAEDGIKADDVKVFVRFYYMTEGWNTRDGEARPGNGSEGSGDPDDPSTFIYEYTTNAEVVGVTYVNAQGMMSNKPFDGLNIIVTHYSDGTTSTTKVFK